MSTIVTVTALVLAAGTAAAYLNLRRKLARRRALERGLKHGWGVIPVRPVGEIFPELRRSDLGPGASTAVIHIANDHTPGGISDYESWILCNLAKACTTMFEFGTATGKTAYLLAANSPPEARVYTLTLPPGDRAAYLHAAGDGPSDRRAAFVESDFERFIYTGTDFAPKITQLVGDSKALDVSPYERRMELVFVDGSHARSYVASDSAKALAMLRPGGTAVWHDYRGPGVTRGVFGALNELAAELALVQIAGTAMVVYRKP